MKDLYSGRNMEMIVETYSVLEALHSPLLLLEALHSPLPLLTFFSVQKSGKKSVSIVLE